jgi:hypothetical protein
MSKSSGKAWTISFSRIKIGLSAASPVADLICSSSLASSS